MVNPTQEQVIAWAREIGVEYHVVHKTLVVRHSNGSWIGIEDIAQELCALAHAAGRKDENEACDAIAAWILKMPENDVSAAIRARREQ